MTRTAMPPRLGVVSSLPDRCDRCTAAAKLHMIMPGGQDLAFCGHHANQHAERILREAAGVVVEDGFDWRGTARTRR